jgi:phosphoribosylamine--glycine ligase
MVKYNIPTSGYVEFKSTEQKEALEYIKTQKYPSVIKADGLAAGKGVLICNSVSDAENAIKEIFVDKVFGASGDKLIIEEFMCGEEASVFAITDGKEFICLPSAQDHKRIGDNDTGKNTGGMGAYSPAPVVTKEILAEVEEKIIAPTIKGMENDGRKFIGCLYCGLMITSEGPKVVEFNCRFGDPETQAVLPILEGDFLQLLYSASAGALDKNAVKYSNGSAVCVVAASKGYPDAFNKGFEIYGLNEVENDIVVFQAGTKEADGKVVTNGGRVLGVTAITKEMDLKLAKQKAYAALEKIHYNGIYFRKDIADRAIL